jgi:replication factor C subunit 2/4
VAGDFQKSQALAEDILKDGFPCLQILEQFGYYVAESELLEDEMKAEICLKLGEVEKKLIDGADEWLQLSHCISVATIVCSTKPEPKK